LQRSGFAAATTARREAQAGVRDINSRKRVPLPAPKKQHPKRVLFFCMENEGLD
jgi:hypothetical protein